MTEVDTVPEVLFVRFRQGVVGETRRCVHIMPLPGHTTFDHLTAYCGQTFGKGEAELVDANYGSMPCEACLAQAPAPGLDAVSAVDHPLVPRIPGRAEPHKLFLHRDTEGTWHVANDVQRSASGATMTTRCAKTLPVVGRAEPARRVPVADYCEPCTS